MQTEVTNLEYVPHISARCIQAAAEYRRDCEINGHSPYRGSPIASNADVTSLATQAAEDYRRAGEFHARHKNFTMATWYTHMYRIYSPFPPDSGVDIELDWSEPK